MNLLTFFVQTSRQDELIKILQQYCGIDTVIVDAPLPFPLTEILADPDQLPTMYMLNRFDQWLVLEVNSVKKLHELGNMISQAMQTFFVQIIYCALVEYAYFLLYHDGKAIREIEGWADQGKPHIDKGEQLTFEEEPVQYFDLDIIAHYCQQLGLDLSNLYDNDHCTILTSSANLPTIKLDQETALLHLLYPVR